MFVCMEGDEGFFEALRLDSALLLRYGSHATCLWIGDSIFDVPGLEAFLGKAVKTAYLSIDTHDALGAAKADCMLGKCTQGLRELQIPSVILPSVIPTTITALRVDLLDPSAYAGEDNTDDDDDDKPAEVSSWNETEADALLFRLAQLPTLQRLFLKLPTQSVRLALYRKITGLEHLAITLQMQKSLKVDLSWVQLQCCGYLRVDIKMDC